MGKATREISPLSKAIPGVSLYAIGVRFGFADRGQLLPGTKLDRFKTYPVLVRDPSLGDIVEIAKTGGITAFRQCQHCRRWMFARRPAIDRFCSAERRDQFHRTNEADKKRRREWAKDNYQSRKRLESGSREAANFRKNKKAKRG